MILGYVGRRHEYCRFTQQTKLRYQGTITIVTEKVVGQTITLLISTEQGTAPVVKGATTNIFKNGDFTDYTLTEQTVTFTGDITIFGCGAEQIIGCALEEIAAGKLTISKLSFGASGVQKDIAQVYMHNMGAFYGSKDN